MVYDNHRTNLALCGLRVVAVVVVVGAWARVEASKITSLLEHYLASLELLACQTPAMATNTQVLLRERPTGVIEPAKTFEVVESPMPDTELAPGAVLVRTIVLSLDPAMRGWLDDVKSYIPPVQIGAVMRCASLGVVERSNNDAFAAGDLVDSNGTGGWQAFFVDRKGRHLTKLAPGTDLLATLGPLGTTGLTA